MDPVGQVVFGGLAWPVGWTVGFVERQLDDVRAAKQEWQEAGDRCRELRGLSVVDQLLLLPPLQAPPMRQLVATSGGWTAHFHNRLLGGDSVGWVVHLSAHFDCRGVIATHIPRGQYPLPATQFLLIETGASFRSRTLTLEQARREYAG